MDKVSKFDKYEKIFLRIHLGILGFGLVMLLIMYSIVDNIDSVARLFLGIVNSLFFVVIINFFISLLRLLKYLFGFKSIDERPTIKRTIIIILTSPVSLGIYFILTLAMSLSLASCSS